LLVDGTSDVLPATAIAGTLEHGVGNDAGGVVHG
jgi:hypothetical protein